MKKHKSRILSMILFVAVLIGCSFQALPLLAEAQQDDLYEIVMQFPTLGTTPQDIQLVEDEINKRVEDELGVHITMFPISAFDLTNTTNLMVSTGEKLDLAISMFEGGVGNYVNKGAIIELDSLIEEYGQDILNAEGIAMSGGYFDGKLYGVPTEEKMARVRAFLARKDLVEKYDIKYDPDHIYSYDEITEIFNIVKDGEGENFYPLSINGSEDPIYMNFNQVDQLGSTIASGVLVDYGQKDDQVINYFETDLFAEDVSYARKWYLNKYLSPDVNTISESSSTLVQSGQYLGYFSSAEPDMIARATMSFQSYLGTDAVPFFTCEPAALTQNYQLTVWMIPITCDNPQKTMEWLNLMYKDTEIINLLYLGIEGEHYVKRGNSEREVDFPEGIDPTNTGYMAILNVWGDKSKDYVMPPLDESYYEELAEFNDSVKPEHVSKVLGYNFNSDPVKTQFAAVSDVVSQYHSSIALGVIDPEVALPEFLNSLEAAGMEDILEENQRQLDLWKKE